MTHDEKLAAIWTRLLAEDEDSEWLWLCLYRLKRAYP